MATTAADSGRAESRRDDPSLDLRRAVVYFVALVICYLGVLVIMHPDFTAPGALDAVAPGIMFAPTMGALAAVVFAAGRIRFGRPSWWILLAFVPPLVVLAVTAAVAALGSGVTMHGQLLSVLWQLPVVALIGCITAVGEEIGWRGFLWPLLRRHLRFWLAGLVMLVVWWLYHLPLVLVGAYGSLGGLPAFTVAITGFIVFVGVLTERSASLWPSVLAHGAWNSTVATAYGSQLVGADRGPLFTGSAVLLGEFGWIAAGCMLIIGVAFGLWHVRHPRGTGGRTSTR